MRAWSDFFGVRMVRASTGLGSYLHSVRRVKGIKIDSALTRSLSLRDLRSDKKDEDFFSLSSFLFSLHLLSLTSVSLLSVLCVPTHL